MHSKRKILCCHNMTRSVESKTAIAAGLSHSIIIVSLSITHALSLRRYPSLNREGLLKLSYPPRSAESNWVWSESELHIQVSTLAHSNSVVNSVSYDSAASSTTFCWLPQKIISPVCENKQKLYFQYHAYIRMRVEFAPFKICFNNYIHVNTVWKLSSWHNIVTLVRRQLFSC